MDIFLHHLPGKCGCGWTIFHWGSKKLSGFHMIHILGLRITWGKLSTHKDHKMKRKS